MKTFYFLSLNLSLALTFETALAADSDRASPERHLSLAEVTTTALAHNPAIKAVEAKWQALKARVPQAAAWEDLRVSAETVTTRFVNIAPNAFMDQRLSIEQVVPITGKNRSRERIAAAEGLSSFEEVRRTKLDVLAKTRAAYFKLANAWTQRELNRRNIVSLKQIADISRAKYEVGTQSAANVLVAETEASKLVETEREIERRIAVEQSALNVLMNRDAYAPLAQPLETTLPAGMFPIDRLRALTLTNRPEVRMAEAAVIAETARLELARREWIPDPAVSVQGSRYNDTGQAVSEIGAGISFSVPWLNYRKYSAAIHEARNNLDASNAALERTRNEAIGLLRNTLEKIETTRHHVELFRDQLVPQAKQAFEANQFSYETGKSGFLDWITAQRNYRDIEALGRDHLADYQTALAELEGVVGADLKIFPAQARLTSPSSK